MTARPIRRPLRRLHSRPLHMVLLVALILAGFASLLHGQVVQALCCIGCVSALAATRKGR